MLTREQFNARITRQQLDPGSSYEELVQLGSLIAEVMGITYTFAASGAPVGITGVTTEAVLASITIPAKLLNINGVLRVTTLWSANNDASAKTVRVRLGSTVFSSGSVASVAGMQGMCLIRNRGAYNSQICHASLSASMTTTGTAVVSGAEDTAVDKVLEITAQLGDAADTVTLEGYTVEVMPAG